MNSLNPKVPTIVTGRERYRDAAAITAARAALGLGTMAVQNSNSVSITGGAATGLTNLTASNGTITSLNTTSVYASYIGTTSGAASGAWSAGNLYVGNGGFDNNGTTGLQAEFVTTSGTISGNYTIVLLDASTAACTGTPSTTACSTYTNSTDCTARDSHGGCSWNAINCYVWNGDESSCNANSGYGCTWESASCSGTGAYDQSSCESYSGCTWTNNPQSCSVYDSDQYNCQNTSGCSWNAETTADCSAFNGDQSTCESTSGCSWSDPDCTGTYVSSPSYCSGSYDSYSCDGTYYTGNCTGSGGYCSGTANCAGIDDNTNCTNETGCSWTTVINATLPTLVDDRVYCLKNISSGGQDAIIYTTTTTPATTINGASSYTLADTNDAIWIVGKTRTGSCGAYVSEGACTAVVGCSWTGIDCGGLDESTCTSTSGCSWDSMSSTCSGTYNYTCNGVAVLSKNWYITASHGI